MPRAELRHEDHQPASVGKFVSPAWFDRRAGWLRKIFSTKDPFFQAPLKVNG